MSGIPGHRVVGPLDGDYDAGMPPLRIAVLCEYASLNGGERSLLSVIDHLPRPEFEFIVLCPSPGALADQVRVRSVAHVPFAVRNLDGHLLPREDSVSSLRAITDEFRPELIHANSLSMGRLTGAAVQQLGIPCSAHLRDIVRLSAAAIADLNRNRGLVAVSHATREFHVAQGLDPSHVDVIYNGIDCNAFAPRPAAGGLKAELGLSPDAFLVTAIGQIGLRKGLDILAEAAVLNRDLLPETHYLIIGERHSNKPESIAFEHDLHERFRTAGLRDRLHLLGRRDDVPRLLNEVDLLVHPARQEPFGRVLLEAAASGVPIVATDVGGTREMLGDDCGWIVDPGDAAHLASSIRTACHEVEQRRVMAGRARERIARRFAIQDRAAELGRFWRAALEG